MDRTATAGAEDTGPDEPGRTGDSRRGGGAGKLAATIASNSARTQAGSAQSNSAKSLA